MKTLVFFAIGMLTALSCAAAEGQKGGDMCEVALIRNSLTLRLAHHAPVGQLKEVWKAPLKKHARFRTQFRDFDPLRIAEISNQEESVVASADDGDRLYLLLNNPSWKGNQVINPAVPKYRLACFVENGTELWSKDLNGEWLQALAPAFPGVLVQQTGKNSEPLGGIYVSPAGEIRSLQSEGAATSYYGQGGLCAAMRRGHYWSWEMLAAHSGFLEREFDQGKVTLVSPSKTYCSGWVEPGDYWYVRNGDGTGAMYELVSQQGKNNEISRLNLWTRELKILRLDLATRELLVRSLYHDENNFQNRDWHAITRRCLGILDDGAVWIEETADGMILHSTDLRTGKDRTLHVPQGRAPMQYQLTCDGKLFFYQGYRSGPYRMRTGNKSLNGWFFLANARRMHANPEPCDVGPQSLWTGHPQRVMSVASLMVLQEGGGGQDDVRARQEAMKAESSAINERRAGPSGPHRNSWIGAEGTKTIVDIATSRTLEELLPALTRPLTASGPRELDFGAPCVVEAVPFEMRDGVVRWAAEFMAAKDRTIVAGGGYGNEASESVDVAKARRQRREVFFLASHLDVPSAVGFVRQAAKDPDPLVRRDAWPMLWTIGGSADMRGVEECYASLPAHLKSPVNVQPPPKTQLRQEQLIRRNWDGSKAADVPK